MLNLSLGSSIRFGMHVISNITKPEACHLSNSLPSYTSIYCVVSCTVQGHLEGGLFGRWHQLWVYLQYLAEAGWTAEGRVVGVTQPRRVAAVTVSFSLYCRLCLPFLSPRSVPSYFLK